jgi:hypothetical protein
VQVFVDGALYQDATLMCYDLNHTATCVLKAQGFKGAPRTQCFPMTPAFQEFIPHFFQKLIVMAACSQSPERYGSERAVHYDGSVQHLFDQIPKRLQTPARLFRQAGHGA